MNDNVRREHDFLGEKDVPDHCYYGVQTLRAMENFRITGVPISHFPELIKSLAYVKKAAALANMELGVLQEDIGGVIVSACDEIIGGKLHDQFTVDLIQGGAGTSTNMNANEVIANRALEIMGRKKGEYDVIHPNNHVNYSQSTNDAYPTALKITLHVKLARLMDSLRALRDSLSAKGEEYADILKIGRTQLQDAVPMTLGQEFSAFATTINTVLKRVNVDQDLILEINLGATAIGTGINALPEFGRLATGHLRNMTGIPLILPENLIEATWDTSAFLQISSVLKLVAVKLSKICNDLRLLSSGPRAGFNEINLPQAQPGSSIMPGKVNPVIPEVVNQVAFQVIGADVTINMAAEAGQLQLNVMEPVMAYNLFLSINMLRNACLVLKEKCVDGITANRERCAEMVLNSTGTVTALSPILGYEISSSIARESLDRNMRVYDVLLEKNLLSREELDEIFSTENMMNPTFMNTGKNK